MIERHTIDGREATVCYIDDSFNPTTRDKASFVKAIFDDGGIMFLVPQPKEDKEGVQAHDKAADEGK